MRIADLRQSAVPSEGYLVAEFPDYEIANLIVNPRRGPIISVPLLDWKAQTYVQDSLFSQFKLTDVIGCTTGEMYSRPVPQVFEVKETQALTSLYEQWSEVLYRRLLREVKPPIQVLNKTSRLGWPVFKAVPSKRSTLLPYFHKMVTDGPEFMRDAFIIMNVRLQAESVNKQRDYLFVSEEGEVYSRTITARDRRISTPDGLRTGSRTRLVFNLPVGNLLTQVLDTSVHNVLLQYDAFHHDMYSVGGAGILTGKHLFFDVRHFERHTSEIVRRRASIIGGLYERISKVFDTLPFLCPSDDWSKKYLLWPNREAGYSDQFASGYSPVAPVQKEIFAVLYAAFAAEHLNMEPDTALGWVLAGGDHRLRIINYGDDNVVCGDPALVDMVLPFLNSYLHVEEEIPPKFLGFLYTNNGWKLGVKSYLEKTYLNERRPGSNFRKFPCFGWIEKRKIYSRYGVPEIATRVFPEEERLLARTGHPWNEYIEQAGLEGIRARDMAGLINPHWIQGKDWLMTPEEKLATGEFEGFMPDETSVYLKHLLGKNWSSLLPW